MKNIGAFIIFLYLMRLADMKQTFQVLRPPACAYSNSTYLRDFSIVFQNSKLNVNMDIVKTLHAGLRVNMSFYTRKLPSVPYTSFYQCSLDMCSMLGKRKSNMLKLWFSTFFAYGNFRATCPVPPGHYYIANYKIHELDVPSFLFSGFYRLRLNFIQAIAATKSKDFVIGCEVEVEIK